MTAPVTTATPTGATGARPGFFEESDRARSMTRLCAFMLCCGVEFIIMAIVVVAVRHPDNALAIIGALAAAATPIVTGIWAALKERA